MNTNIAPTAEYRECFKCWYQDVTATERCPRCGRNLHTSRSIRNRGIVLVVVGLFLAGFMAAIAVLVGVLLAGSMKDPASAKKINAEAGFLIATYGLFAMVIAFGLHSVVNGVFLIITGRRSRMLVWIMWALLFALLFVGGALRALL